MTMKILVVDDEADLELLIKQKFRRQIRENRYQFGYARNGLQALDHLRQYPDTDIVLSDINMPEMDGLSLLSHLSVENPLTKTIMVSAYGDMDNIRTAMNRGAFDFICKPVNFSDLELTMEKTARHVTQIRQTLQAIQENNVLKMYVDETVLKFMANPGFEQRLMVSETLDATVVFVDICGFTSITETLPAVTVVELINQYFDLMVKEIIAQEGYIDKFIGDAILAVFKGEYHLDRAIDAALAVRDRIEAIREPATEQTNYRPQVSIGINAGEMVSGNIGSVSLRRLDFTVIGDAVNLAQRLQGIARPGQIVISEQTYEKVKENFHCERIGEVVLKNKAISMVVYQVLE